MAPSVEFVLVVPSRRRGVAPTVVTDTTEAVKLDLEAEAHGFRFSTWYPTFLPSPPRRIRIPFSRPLFFTWSYTDSSGYPRSSSRISYSSKNSLRGVVTTPVVPEWSRTCAFSANVHVQDRFAQNEYASAQITVHRTFEVDRKPQADGPAPNDDPVVEQVSAVHPGGPTGSTVNYTESTAFTRSRTYTISFKTQASVGVGLPVLRAGYGFDVQETVSSSANETLQRARTVQQTIPPGQYGIWFRKVEPYERPAELHSVDDMGKRQRVGRVIVTDYVFSYYLGIGDSEAAAQEDARRRLGD